MIENPRFKNTGKRLAAQRGFSLFELVVFIIAVAIIYATAANRFGEFPGEAERANFLAVTTQLQAALNLELMLAMTSGQRHLLNSYGSANPMDMLLETPRNYVGAFDGVDVASLPRRIWYFDRQRNELVYLINDTDDVFLVNGNSRVPTEEIRFRLNLVYRDGSVGIVSPPDSAISSSGPGENESNAPKRVSGLLLEPVIPYLWSPTDADLILLASAGEPS